MFLILPKLKQAKTTKQVHLNNKRHDIRIKKEFPEYSAPGCSHSTWSPYVYTSLRNTSVHLFVYEKPNAPLRWARKSPWAFPPVLRLKLDSFTVGTKFPFKEFDWLTKTKESFICFEFKADGKMSINLAIVSSNRHVLWFLIILQKFCYSLKEKKKIPIWIVLKWLVNVMWLVKTPGSASFKCVC